MQGLSDSDKNRLMIALGGIVEKHKGNSSMMFASMLSKLKEMNQAKGKK